MTTPVPQPVTVLGLGVMGSALASALLDRGHRTAVWYPGDDATIDVPIAAIEHLLHAAADRGLDNALPELLKSTMERANAAGHGSDSFAGVVEVLRRAEVAA
ncbi:MULTISPECIES: imine reductase family protein [Saccharothrix]|uniref:imine reductase family protein n=1 Tax=Saccharothrix TaxID=2071 RepID=UPI002378B0BC|nr:NAD(P)-binding domain-containing protein [Saccharothrix sp. CB00851]